MIFPTLYIKFAFDLITVKLTLTSRDHQRYLKHLRVLRTIRVITFLSFFILQLPLRLQAPLAQHFFLPHYLDHLTIAILSSLLSTLWLGLHLALISTATFLMTKKRMYGCYRLCVYTLLIMQFAS